jgi:putative phosphoribosyl transferase
MTGYPLPTGWVEIAAAGVRLPGECRVPADATGLVIFAHGSGSGRLSPRNRQVAETLNAQRLATLLFDLLTDEEAGDRRNVFDVELLAQRLEAGKDWASAQPALAGLRMGYFGASTGAAAALIAVADSAEGLEAVVSRGGRPDLAAERLAAVRAPTLLIVGGADVEVLRLNELALERLRAPSRLTVIPGATHLFEEPGALEKVAELSAAWFTEHLSDRT